MAKLLKKPWGRDLKKENKPVVDVRDSYTAISNNRESTTYEYFEDPRVSVDLTNDRFSLWDDSGGTNTMDRNSTLQAFKQDSCYFDRKMTSKEKNPTKSKSELRLSTGIVSHEISKDEDGTMSFGAPKRRLNPPKSISHPRASTMPPALDTMQEGEEGDEDSSSNDGDNVQGMTARTRSNSPPAPGNRQTDRPAMTRSNSWTSNSELNLKKKKKKKTSSTKDLASKKKRKDGNSTSDTTKKKRIEKERAMSPTRPNSDPLRKKKENASVDLSPSREKSSVGAGRSGAGSRSPKRGVKPRRPRNRSSSPEKKKVNGGGTRPGLMRRNSWTSNSNLNANSGKTAERIARSTPKPLGLIDEKPVKKGGSKKKLSSKKKERMPGEKGKSGRSQSPKRSNGPEKKSGKKLMAGLRKSRAIAQSISIVSTKGNVDSEEMKMLQNQLRQAMEETMRLKEEHDKDKQSPGTAMTETDELQQMLAESAKENMELLLRLEEQAGNARENNAKVESMSKELEQLREENAKKDAMLTKLQQELSAEKSGVEKGQGTVASLRSELDITKDELTAALSKLESSEERVEGLENRLRDAETVEKGLQNAIEKWTDKAFLWQEKAERLELELAKNLS